MTFGRWFSLAIVGVALAGGCAGRDGASGKERTRLELAPGESLIEGTVVHHITRERGGSVDFVPNSGQHEGEMLRLTRSRQLDSIGPMAEQIDLRSYAGQTIRVKYRGISSGWIWGAQIAQ
jgi:hypothetical protein